MRIEPVKSDGRARHNVNLLEELLRSCALCDGVCPVVVLVVMRGDLSSTRSRSRWYKIEMSLELLLIS